jgi:divalent metal cation (Fe/Co/Zn/Cd) transporter
MYTTRRLQQFAIGISILSIIYNGAEGAVSIYFGETAASNSLIFFGIQSAVEVLSACFVVWRFFKVARPGEEGAAVSNDLLKKERSATIGIGILFGILAVGTWVTSIVSLVRHNHPDTSTPSLIISASALVLMILIWLPKPWLAKSLNSSAMHGEAKCSLACIYITAVLLAGTLVYKFWENGWWVDSAVAIVLGAFFAKESFEMIRWGTSKGFSGGCCDSCNKQESTPMQVPTLDQESAPKANPCVDIKCCSGCDK